MPSRLVLVPTPVGNLEDITLRALETLRSASLILAEDTRTSAKLMQKYDISAPMAPYHLNNEHQVVESLADRIAHETGTVCLVTDAGTPGISDPGYMLTRACIQRGVQVTCLPGSTAFVPALVASGLPSERFYFEGFLPPKKGRASRIKEITDRTVTTILYESPMRLTRLLEEINTHIGGDREVVVAREISKLHETFHRGSAAELLDYFTQTPPLGEIVVLVAPAPKLEKSHSNKYKSDNISVPDKLD